MFKGFSPRIGIKASTKSSGDAAEDRALRYLQQQGLRLVERNYRVARGPSARGGEIDLILSERDGTLVFVEVRARASASHGGAAASVTKPKQRHLLLAAQHYLLRYASAPPCRFDVLALEGTPGEERVEWFKAAFDASL